MLYFFCLIINVLAMVLLESEKIPMGSLAPDFSLPGVDGKEYSLSDFSDAKILVVMFICNHCPYVQAVIDRIVAIQDDYADKEVALVAISSNDATNYPDDGFENMREMAQEHGLNIYLYDEAQDVARAYKAQCTPDMFVYENVEGQWKMAYHGRIDDNWQDESAVTKHEMRDALDSLLRGDRSSDEQYPSMGCSIKWKN